MIGYEKRSERLNENTTRSAILTYIIAKIMFHIQTHSQRQQIKRNQTIFIHFSLLLHYETKIGKNYL